MIGLLLALYPAHWRRRYGEEFRAVLESRPLGPFDVADVVLGALDARLTFRFAEPSSANGGQFNMLRIGGFGAVFGGAAWFIGIAAASGIGTSDGRLWMAVALAGTLGLLVALVGLSAFQGHRDPRLAWIALGIPGIGAAVAASGIAGMLLLPESGRILGQWSPWDLWILGMFTNMVGSIFFSIATYQARVLSSRAAGALGISSGAALLVALASMSANSNAVVAILMVASLGAFALSWMWLGASALRRGPIRVAAAV